MCIFRRFISRKYISMVLPIQQSSFWNLFNLQQKYLWSPQKNAALMAIYKGNLIIENRRCPKECPAIAQHLRMKMYIIRFHFLFLDKKMASLPHMARYLLNLGWFDLLNSLSLSFVAYSLYIQHILHTLLSISFFMCYILYLEWF